MQELILHIGRHKSGTSSLQDYLFSNQNNLATQGVLYPNAGLAGKIAHHDLAKFLNQNSMDVNKYRNLKRRFRQETKGFEHIIVSSEEFQNCKKMENVTDFFQGLTSMSLSIIVKYLITCKAPTPNEYKTPMKSEILNSLH